MAGIFILGAPLCLQAVSPDMEGYFDGGINFRVQRYEQAIHYSSSGHQFDEDYQVQSAMSYGLGWRQPLCDALSFALNASFDSYDSQLKDMESTGAGSFADSGQGNDSLYGAGLDLHSGALFGHGFDPFHFRNPDGPQFWPRVIVHWYDASQHYVKRTVSADGGFRNIADNYSDTDQVQMLYYELLLPVGGQLSLDVNYEKEYRRDSSYQNGSVPGSLDTGGRYEIEGVNAELFSTWWKCRDELPYGYVPGVGFDGQGRTSLSYTQGYDLISQMPNFITYEIFETLALEQGFGISLGYSMTESQQPFFNIKGSTATITKTQPWSQELEFGIEYGWGAWGPKRPPASAEDSARDE